MAHITNEPFSHKYVGARYVPKFADDRNWNVKSTYEALTMVQTPDATTESGYRYWISTQPVPDNIEINNAEYWVEVFSGIQGIQGIQGPKGDAATIAVGNVEALPNGTSPYVMNTGTENAAIFDFGLETGPKGDKGDTGKQGPKGDAYVLTDNDKANIAQLVYNEIGDLDGVKF